ncbi:helix-turn-helix domain-containing protein [Oceanidesulfovibrio indonesiensis]|nr:helix-turn-helix domain-containing protein [Oceanidesulfovibrio indonesiensis]
MRSTDSGSIDAAAVLGRMIEVTNASSQTELAEILGVGKAAISDAKTRGALPASWLLKLSRPPYSANPVWLEMGLGPRRIDQQAESAGPLLRPQEAVMPSGTRPQKRSREIPVARLALSARGDGLALDDSLAPPVSFSEVFLDQFGESGALRLVSVEHRHAAVGAERGDWLLVDESRKDIVEGALHVLRFGPDVVMRRVRRRADEIVLGSSEGDESLPAGRHGLAILGIVVWMGRTLP